jgi:hypothetical protein
MFMKIRIVKAAISLAALIAAALPLASQANDNPALDLCVEKFVEAVVPANYPAEIRREDIVASIKPINGTKSKVILIAKGEKDAKLYGRASCTIHRKGSIVSMYLYDAKEGQPGLGRPTLIARHVDAKQVKRDTFADNTKPF